MRVIKSNGREWKIVLLQGAYHLQDDTGASIGPFFSVGQATEWVHGHVSDDAELMTEICAHADKVEAHADKVEQGIAQSRARSLAADLAIRFTHRTASEIEEKIKEVWRARHLRCD